MNLRKSALAVALGAALSLPAQAITIDGITFAAGAILETIDIFEGAAGGGPIVALGQELIGIGIVNRILDSGNNVLWTNGDNGRELTIHFHSYFAEDFATNGAVIPGLDVVRFSGGVLEIYSDTAEDFSAAGTLAAGVASATGGDLFLSLTGSPTGGFGPFTGDPVTLTSVAIRTTGAVPFITADNITGTGNLDVTGGSAATYFDTNTFNCAGGLPCPDDADKQFSSSGQIPVGGAGSWAFRGTGEVQDFAVVVPEPGTLALLGLGLAGLGGLARRASRVAALV